MSYDIRVVRRKSGETVVLKNKIDLRGGTYCEGGTDEACLNITYNYAKFFYEIWPKKSGEKVDTRPFFEMFNGNDGGIRSLYGKPLDEVIAELDKAVLSLKGERDEDYWKSAEGNARAALFNLKVICEIARMENQGEDLTINGD